MQSYISRRLQQAMLIYHLLSVGHLALYHLQTVSVSPTILLHSQLSALAKKSSPGKLSCNHGAASEKDKEEKNKLHLLALIIGKPKSEVSWASLWVTHHRTETCNAHAGRGTDAQTGTGASSTSKKNASSEKGKIPSGLSQKTASKSSIPAAALAKDCVRKGAAAATRSGAATLRQTAHGMSVHTLSCLVDQ